MKFLKETILKETISIPAGATPGAVIRKFSCSLNDLSPQASYGSVSPVTAIPALFGRYCITGVKWTFIPAYTMSTSGGIRASRVCYATNRDTQDVLNGENDIIRQDDVKFSNSTRKFSVYVKHPKPALATTALQMVNTTHVQGLGPNQYPPPETATPSLLNQVAWTTGDNKWIWLPTRIVPGSEQYPDHLGLDFVMTPPSGTNLPDVQEIYYVYQTIFLALKEQD